MFFIIEDKIRYIYAAYSFFSRKNPAIFFNDRTFHIQFLVEYQSCQVDLVKDSGHKYFIKFLDTLEALPVQRAMAAFVLAVIVDGYQQGQEACIQAGLIHVCLRHLQLANLHDPNDSQDEPLLLQWLCLCLGKLWEDFPEAQMIGLQADAPSICSNLLFEPQPEVCFYLLKSTILEFAN